MLKEIVTRYDNAKCAKCDRDIKKGWTVLFDPDKKVVYCLPCGKILQGKEIASGGVEKEVIEPVDNTDFSLLLNELTGDIRLFNDTLADTISKFMGEIFDIKKDIANTKLMIVAISEVLAEKKKTKKTE